ncbi:MAG: hypothetical protein LUF82_04750 [Clostridia bacterium]|nr:hypothetical protein [Clostridia bacterium]
MKYIASFKRAENLLKTKYKVKEISLNEIVKPFPCCGYENGKIVEISAEEQTITLYTEDEITVSNFKCYLIDDKEIIKRYTNIEKTAGVTPEKVLTVLGLNQQGNKTLQLYTSFGIGFQLFNDLIKLSGH